MLDSMANCKLSNSLNQSREYNKFELQLKDLLLTLESLQGPEIRDALLLLKNAIFSKFSYFDSEVAKNQEKSRILAFKQDKGIIYSTKDKSVALDLQINLRNCLWDKSATLDSCSVPYTVIPLDSSISYDFQNSNSPNCSSEIYLNHSQRDKVLFELEKDYAGNQKPDSDEEVILNLCSKNKEQNYSTIRKNKKKDFISTDDLADQVLVPPFDLKNTKSDLEFHSELDLKFSRKSALNLPFNSNKEVIEKDGQNDFIKHSTVLPLHVSQSVIQSTNSLKPCTNSFPSSKEDTFHVYSSAEPLNSSSITECSVSYIKDNIVSIYSNSKIEQFNNYSTCELSKKGMNVSTSMLTHRQVFCTGESLPMIKDEKPSNDFEPISCQNINDKVFCDEPHKIAVDSSGIFKSMLSKCDGALNLVSKNFKHKSVERNASTEHTIDDTISSNSYGIQGLSQSSCISNAEVSANIMDETTLSKEIQNKTTGTTLTSPLSCKRCCSLISDESLWKSHELVCNNKFYCPHCDINFNTKTVYLKHMSCHQRNSCKWCPRTFRRQKLLEAHMKKEHKVSGNVAHKLYICEYCDHVMKKRSSLYHHLKSHALPNQKVCQKCGKFIEGELAYQTHIEEHFKSADMKCNLCEETFIRRQNYNDHIKAHEINCCKYCEKSFSSKKSLYYHCKTEHPTLPQTVSLNKSHKCDKCDKVFIRPSLLRDHKFTHSDPNSFTCQPCNVRFVDRSTLRKHLKSILHKYTSLDVKLENNTNTDSKDIYACEHCGIVYPSLSLLKKHSFKVHSTRPFLKCVYCDYKTQKKIDMKRHTDTHLGCENKKFICEICGGSFISLTSLKEHNIFIHSDERPHQCTMCEKRFKNKSCLYRHKRTHSNERPFKCECGASYKQFPHLVRHLSSVHSKKVKTNRIKRITEKELGVINSNSTSIVISNASQPANSTWVGELDPEKAHNQDANDMLIASSGTALMNDDENIGEHTPLFTVLDSQFIHLIPSALGQEVFQTVSLVNGELHTLSIGSPYTPIHNSEESFANCESIIIHSSHSTNQDPLTLDSLPSASANELSSSINSIEMSNSNSSEPKVQEQKESLQIPGLENTIQFSSNSLTTLNYENSEEQLQSANYLTQQTSTHNQDNISIF